MQETLEKLFIDFFALSNYNMQNSYLFGLVEGHNCRKAYKKDRVQPDFTQRNNTFKYFVKDPGCGFKRQVCRNAFCTVHGITNSRLRSTRGEYNIFLCYYDEKFNLIYNFIST